MIALLRWIAGLALALLLITLVGAMLTPSWRVQASEISRASPRQIWAWYANSGRTPNWDHLVSVRTMAGPFATGTRGSNRGESGPAFAWIFTDVVTNDHYTEVTKLPLATLTATHVLTPVPNGTRIDHALIVAGPFAWLYRFLFYSSFEPGIHSALHRLASGADHGPPPANRMP